MTASKAQPDPVAALMAELPECRRLTADEVRDVRNSLATHSPENIAGRLQIPVHVVHQIARGTYFSIVK